MEQDQEVRELEQVVVWVEAKVAEDVVREAVLRQDRAVIAFAPNVVKEQPIKWGPHVMNSNAQSVALQ
jgi:redox-sensitive bicupin YhaK (pirin superfamily)